MSNQNPYMQMPEVYGQQGYPPPQGYPPQGYPPQGYPPQGYPPQGYPPQPSTYPPPSSVEIDMTNSNKKYGGGNDNKQSKVEINDNPQYQDIWAAILYILVFIVTIVIAVVAIPKMDLSKLKTTSSSSTKSKTKSTHYYRSFGKRDSDGGEVKDIVGIIGTAAVVSILLTYIYFKLVQRFTGKMIKGTFILSIILYFIMAGIYTIIIPYLGIFLFVIAILYGLCWFFWRDRIPFARIMLKTVVSIISQYKGTLVVGIIGAIIGCIWYAFIGVTLVATATYWGSDDSKAVISYIIYVFLAFSFYYSSQVINNVVHVTVSGLFATYFFLGTVEPGTNKIEISVKNPTIQSFKRAVTTSFGSICFGSLVIAIIQTLRFLAHQLRHQAADDNDTLLYILACCLECIIGCIEDIVEYFNVYAFTQVAIYGKPFCQAAKDTWALFKQHGIEVLINDDLIGNIMFIGSLLVGLISGCSGLGIGYIVFDISNVGTLVMYGLIALLMGTMIFSVVAQVINSGVSTIFVCIAEDSESLQRTKPELYDKIRESYSSIIM